MARTLPIGMEHELLEKLEKAGLTEIDAARVIGSRGNALAKQVVLLVRDEVNKSDFFTFQTTELTLRELWNQNRELFYTKDQPWWWNEDFATRKGEVREMNLKLSAIEGSFNKTWSEQQEMIPDGHFVPNVRDTVEGMIVHYRETGRRIYPEYYVRIQDVASDGDRVNVGNFDQDGLHVDNYWGDYRDDYLGLVSARNS